MTGGPARAIWHRTMGGSYASNIDTLKTEGFEPHLLWDPHTGQLGQFIPSDVGAFAVQHTETLQTNRMGSACIQIEVVDHDETWDITSTPMKGLEHIIGWLRELGIPDELPAGPMAALGKSGTRDPKIWATKGGHYGHCHIPENDHTDPGHMDFTEIFGAVPVASGPRTLTSAQRAGVEAMTAFYAGIAKDGRPLTAHADTLTNSLIRAAHAASALK